jgi:outer membrane autotransporter protein
MQMLASVMKCNGNTIKTNKNLQKLQGVSVMKSIANKSVKPLLAPIAAFVLAALATPALAHTSSIGFTNTGNGSVTFWFGTYHSGVNYTEGSMQVVSSNSTTTTSAFNLLVSTRPTGLVDGTNNFYSNGTSLVRNAEYHHSLLARCNFYRPDYRHLYLYLSSDCKPDFCWQPTNSVILSSTVTLSASLFNSGNIYDSAYGERNSPALSAAKVIDNNSALSNLFSGLTTDQQRSNAASQTLPLLTGSTTNTAKTVLTSVNNIVDSRQYANHGGSSGDDFQVSNEFWMKPFGTIANQADSDGVNGYKVNTAGVAIGADRKINPALTLGVATAFSNSNVHSDISGGGVQGMNVKSIS